MIIFSALHRIASNHVVLNRIEIGSHCIVIGVKRIASHRIGSCFICIFNVSYRWLCIEVTRKLAPQMAATVLCSSVFVLFLFVFFVSQK